MDWQRVSLLAGIGLVTVLLLIRWGEYQEANRPEVDTSTIVDPTSQIPVEVIPTAAAPENSSTEETSADEFNPDPISKPAQPIESTQPKAAQKLITINTDVLNLRLNTRDGDIVYVSLPQFPTEIDSPDEPLVLLNINRDSTYIAKSGIYYYQGDKRSPLTNLFTSERDNYSLAEDQDELVVDLTREVNSQLTITKRFTFRRGDYLVDVDYIIDSNRPEEWRTAYWAEIVRDGSPPSVKQSGIGISSFLGAATSTEDDVYQKFSFSDLDEKTFKQDRENSWMAMVQHYFVSAWIPPKNQIVSYEFKEEKGLYSLRLINADTVIAPGTSTVMSSSFYAGPKDIKRLSDAAQHLEKTVDYGWLWFIGKPLFYLLDFFHDQVGNWGVAIILLTIVVKLALFYLSDKSYRSMAKMRKLAPKMQQLKERYGDNRQKFSEEMIKLYRKEGTNPMGGCLPMLAQMPIFLALYWVLMESVELRHAPFFLWIEDLSIADPFFILPILYGLTMYLQQKMQPMMTTDPTQAKIMKSMPFIFMVFFIFFASGLVLYWVVNTTIGIIHQYFVTKKVEAEG